MLFRRKMERYCTYCQFAGKIDGESMVCQKFRIAPAGHHSRRFRYDPLKRIPGRQKPKEFQQFDQKDFSL